TESSQATRTGILHVEFGDSIAGVKNQREEGRTHAVEDSRHRLEVSEINIKRAQSRNDDEVRENEGPSAYPCSPEAAAEVGNVDAYLDGERPGQRLADSDGLSHLLLRQPSALCNQFFFHLANKGHWSAKAQQPKA